jgi:hypothetical protein
VTRVAQIYPHQSFLKKNRISFEVSNINQNEQESIVFSIQATAAGIMVSNETNDRQPILTPKTVLPTFFVIGFIFFPLGIGLFIASNNVSQIILDYSNCDQAPATLSSANAPGMTIFLTASGSLFVAI